VPFDPALSVAADGEGFVVAAPGRESAQALKRIRERFEPPSSPAA